MITLGRGKTFVPISVDKLEPLRRALSIWLKLLYLFELSLSSDISSHTLQIILFPPCLVRSSTCHQRNSLKAAKSTPIIKFPTCHYISNTLFFRGGISFTRSQQPWMHALVAIMTECRCTNCHVQSLNPANIKLIECDMWFYHRVLFGTMPIWVAKS